MNDRQRMAVAIGAVGVGALILGQAWRRRHPYVFEGRSVVITGGSRGLGLVMARALAQEGARLTLVARDEQELARDNIVVTTVCPGLMRTGSPLNAMFKGRQPQEYAWFAISDSLPVSSINAERAARQIVNACRYGDAELIITVQAKMAVFARYVAPELFADLMAVVNRLLPEPAAVGGDEARPGRESESEWAAPSATLTTSTYKAAAANNELKSGPAFWSSPPVPKVP